MSELRMKTKLDPLRDPTEGTTATFSGKYDKLSSKDTYRNDVVNGKTCKKPERRETNREQDAQKKLDSEQLQVATDENPTCTTRELSKTFHVSRHMTVYREMKRLGEESLKG
ncbi:hypothetical protein ACTXT7_013932 [Hymenolepis weldensis]